MAKVFPFQGYRYNPEKVGDLNKVVTQPYDKIDCSMQQRYYEASPYNIVRVILGREEEEGENKYEKAAEHLSEWIDEGVLVRDSEPGFYVYSQKYRAGGEKRTRLGFVGLGELEGEGGVKAHENTMEGPKADRLKLLRATEANFGHIFMLYKDPEHEVSDMLKEITDQQEPLLEVKDEDRNGHVLWKLEQAEVMEKIQETMEGKSLYIADGHHRYETALNYRAECEEKGWSSPDRNGFNHRMMTFINLYDPGLSILATHRLVYDLEQFNPRGLLEKARERFAIRRFETKEEMFDQLDRDRENRHTFGYRAKGGHAFWTLTLQKEEIMDRLIKEHSSEWRHLDVSILHKAIFEPYLGIGEEQLEEKSNVEYVRYRNQALKMLEENNYQAAFILNPTSVEQMAKIADEGERMPQKTTDFYPKLLTGLVLHKLSINKG